MQRMEARIRGPRGPLSLAEEIIFPERIQKLLAIPPASKQIQLQYAWNPEDKSPNITVKDDNLTFHHNVCPGIMEGIRGKTSFNIGLHVWEIKVDRKCSKACRCGSMDLWGHEVIGVATANAPLTSSRYNVVDSQDQSWGWCMLRDELHHGVEDVGVYPAVVDPNLLLLFVPEEFKVVLDMDEGTLAFVVNGQYLGVAFQGLKGKNLYPFFSIVCPHCEVTMKYIGGLVPKPLPLTFLARDIVRQSVGKDRLCKINELHLPQRLKDFLLYKQQ